MVLLGPPLGPPRAVCAARAVRHPVSGRSLFGGSGLRRLPDRLSSGTDRAPAPGRKNARRPHRRPRGGARRARGADARLLRLQRHPPCPLDHRRAGHRAAAGGGKRRTHRYPSDGLRSPRPQAAAVPPGPVPCRSHEDRPRRGPGPLLRIPRALLRQGLRPAPGLHPGPAEVHGLPHPRSLRPRSRSRGVEEPGPRARPRSPAEGPRTDEDGAVVAPGRKRCPGGGRTNPGAAAEPRLYGRAGGSDESVLWAGRRRQDPSPLPATARAGHPPGRQRKGRGQHPRAGLPRPRQRGLHARLHISVPNTHFARPARRGGPGARRRGQRQPRATMRSCPPSACFSSCDARTAGPKRS